MKELVLERVRLLIDKKANGSESRLSKLIGVPQGTLNCQLNGKRGISLETIIAILVTFPDVSAEWLLRGSGDIMHSGKTPAETPLMTNVEITNTMLTINSLSKKVNELYEENQRLKEQIKK